MSAQPAPRSSGGPSSETPPPDPALLSAHGTSDRLTCPCSLMACPCPSNSREGPLELPTWASTAPQGQLGAVPPPPAEIPPALERVVCPMSGSGTLQHTDADQLPEHFQNPPLTVFPADTALGVSCTSIFPRFFCFGLFGVFVF